MRGATSSFLLLGSSKDSPLVVWGSLQMRQSSFEQELDQPIDDVSHDWVYIISFPGSQGRSRWGSVVDFCFRFQKDLFFYFFCKAVLLFQDIASLARQQHRRPKLRTWRENSWLCADRMSYAECRSWSSTTILKDVPLNTQNRSQADILQWAEQLESVYISAQGSTYDFGSP